MSLPEKYKTGDWDYFWLHGMFGQGQTLDQDVAKLLFGKEYTKYDYTPLIKTISPLLNKIFNPMKLTKEQVKKIYVIWGLGLGDKEAIVYWTGRELDELLDARLADLQKELDQI